MEDLESRLAKKSLFHLWLLVIPSHWPEASDSGRTWSSWKTMGFFKGGKGQLPLTAAALGSEKRIYQWEIIWIHASLPKIQSHLTTLAFYQMFRRKICTFQKTPVLMAPWVSPSYSSNFLVDSTLVFLGKKSVFRLKTSWNWDLDFGCVDFLQIIHQFTKLQKSDVVVKLWR